MLQSYFPIYQIALNLQELRNTAEVFGSSSSYKSKVSPSDAERFDKLLIAIQQKCLDYSLTYTSDLAKRVIIRTPPETYEDMVPELNHLNDLLSYELEKEAIFRIPPDRKGYYGQDDLFGPAVARAFPSCMLDIQNAGSCYALAQADACVHHLMLVLERGLNALAVKLEVTYERNNWQTIIQNNASKLKSRGPEFDFHREANAQFGFLKDAYRNHSEHARDDHYDMHKARSILDHVRSFMQEMANGGLSE